MAFTPPSIDDVETVSSTGFVPPSPNEVDTNINAFTPPAPHETAVTQSKSIPSVESDEMQFAGQVRALQKIHPPRQSLLPKPASDFIAKWSIPGEAEQILDKAGLTTASKVAGGLKDTTQDLTDFFTSIQGASTLGVGGLPVAGRRAVAGAFSAYMAAQMPEQWKALQNAWARKDTKEMVHIASGAAVNAAGVIGGAKYAFQGEFVPPSKTEVIKDIAPLTAQELKTTAAESPPQPKESSASEISKAAEVHGDVRPQSVQSEGELPLAQSGGGIQPQTQGGIQEVQPAQTPSEPPKEPIVPGGGESTLTPDQRAQSRANNAKEAWAKMGFNIPSEKPLVDQPVNKPAEQKYRIGNNPTPHSLVEVLPQSESEIANNEQPVRVKNDKTRQETVALQSDLTPIKTLTAEEKAAKPVKADLDAQLKDAGLDPSVFKNASQKRAALKREAAISVGPGAASPGDVPKNSELGQLTQSITDSLPKDSPLADKLSMIDQIKEKVGGVKDSVTKSLATAKAVGNAIWDKYTSVPEWTDEKEAVGKWTYANQKADFEARKFAQSITKAISDKLRREAITNWIQADGDDALLRQRADASKGHLKRGYETALKLTDYEKTLARNIGQYFESQLGRGKEAGILGSSVEDYVNQVWKKESLFTRQLKNDFSPGKLQPNFKFAKQRFYDSYFEGEQAGQEPANKDVGALVALYDQSFNKSLAARAFLKDLHEGVASDGRPLVEVSGSGKILEGDKSIMAGGKPDTLLITPKSLTDETSDYRRIDHPAMRGWKWVQTTDDGTQVMLQGDLMVHPEAYTKLRNRLQQSAWRQNPVGRAILGTQSTIKQTMLSVSGFHQVQETLHALGHRVNPMNLEKLDFDNPIQKDLLTHGLKLADYHALEQFAEGLAGGPLLNKVPFVGNKILKPYTEWLFQDYIPRLKVTMAKEALERNTQRYASTLSRDQILEMTSNQANAAFGELNYQFMGRNPTLQDTLRTFLLAPDFLEARAKFVGQAAKPFGREQLAALGLLAATQYITARIFNKVEDNDYHWEPKHAFAYIYKGREYGLRTVPGDIQHLISDPRSFSYNRLSPIIGRGSIELATARDDRGVKRDIVEQVKDMAKTAIPISMRSRDDVKMWESFLNAFGLREKKFTAVSEISDKARKFKEKNKPESPFQEVYDAEKDQYRPLRLALEKDDVKAAQAAYDTLKKTVEPSKINQNIHRYYTKTFTGSKALESKFESQLDEHGKERLKEAKDEQRRHLDIFGKVQK